MTLLYKMKCIVIRVIALVGMILCLSCNSMTYANVADRWILVSDNGDSKTIIDKNSFKYDCVNNTVQCWKLIVYSHASVSTKIEYSPSSRKYKILKFIENIGGSNDGERKGLENKICDILPGSDAEKVANSICDYVGKTHVFDVNDKWIWVYSSNYSTYYIWSHVYNLGNNRFEVYVYEKNSKRSNYYKYIMDMNKETVKNEYTERIVVPGTAEDGMMLKVKQLIKAGKVL
ncbi:hypothetical protein [Selenomonas sp. KH1T6]|uniref:hypothetical protein n=1 Tax=Selenomonas sp. KH1T6 TaxID=3158784 RepID=UPI0008A76F74|nr:hypothetical protein SAMN05216583_1306 [Selenomonas ruminantium]